MQREQSLFSKKLIRLAVTIKDTSDSFRLDVHLMGAFSRAATTSTLTLHAVVNNGTKVIFVLQIF